MTGNVVRIFFLNSARMQRVLYLQETTLNFGRNCTCKTEKGFQYLRTDVLYSNYKFEIKGKKLTGPCLKTSAVFARWWKSSVVWRG